MSDTYLQVADLFKLGAVGSDFDEVPGKPLLYIQYLSGRRSIVGSIKPNNAATSGDTIIDVSKLPDVNSLRKDHFRFKVSSFSAGDLQDADGLYQENSNTIELFTADPLDTSLEYNLSGDLWTNDLTYISINLRDK